MKHISKYLRQLKFDRSLLNTPIAKYITNLRLVILIVLGIAVFGIVSYSGLPRNLYPDVNIPMIYVTTVLPGANPEDVESLVTIPIEDSVRGLNNVHAVTSTSSESVSAVGVEFQTGTDLDKAKTDVQAAIDSVSDLPENSQKPNVMKIDLQKTPIWTFSLKENGNRASLLRFAQKLKQELTDLSSIDSVVVEGMDEREIQIIIRPDAISSFNINPQVLIGAIKTSLNTFPAGNVKTSNSAFSLTINPQIKTIDDIRNLRINLNGQNISISDIAEIVEKSKPDQYPVYIAEKNGKINPTVIFNIFRATNVNIGTAFEDANKLIEEKLSEQNGKFKLQNIVNYAELITEQFNELGKNLIETILLVAIVLFMFLGARQAFVALLATPLTFLISFILMGITGITLNFISVFALLLSLGLLVDDTIVVVSAVTAYYRSGKFTPVQTGLLVWRDFIIAILTTTTTTIWAFLPILISTGIIGEFIKPIPIVVSTTLAGSFLVAMFITLPFILFLLKPNFPRRVIVFSKIIFVIAITALTYFILPKNSLLPLQFLSLIVLFLITFLIRKHIISFIQEHIQLKVAKKNKQRFGDYMESGVLSFQRIEFHYSRFIYKILNSPSARKKIISMVIIFSIFSYILVPLGFVKNEFFPKADGDTLSVSVELPAGTNLYTSRKEALEILENLKNTPETKYVLLNLGSGYNPFGGGTQNQNIFNFTLVFKDKKEKNMTSSKIAQQIRSQYKNYTNGILSVNEQTGGPPAGSDIAIKLFGPDLTVLDSYAQKVEDFLKKEPGATNASKSIKTGTSKIVFIPNEDEMTRYSLTQDVTGFWMRLFATGVKIDSIKLDEDSNVSEDITLRMESQTPNAEDITNVNIPTQIGPVSLASLGKLELEANPTLITREDGKRTISITAGVKSGYTVPQVNAKLEFFANNSLNLPSGYSWATGGVNEENQNSVNTIYKAMLISVLLIIITMILQFNSFRRAIIVILVIPLSISGVFIVFALTQIPLTFPALVGVLALFGIVVKNSILIMDKIMANIKTGMEYSESIADAAASRLEPIALTSICAIVGLIPITISDPLWRGLGGAIIAGLTFSGTIMLFFIPVVYYIVFKPRK
ncbi:MAG: hypothetical protein A2171_01290 [Candidatus Levybacteria bacterium RBG_13_35_9]|nr:MAG: hypothetical protein A2171_01290 [Candidatus Levybacteria bacterium RBG_13_35_9]